MSSIPGKRRFRWTKWRVFGAILVLLLMAAGGAYVYLQGMHNQYASCANCRRQVSSAMMQYALENDGWYPRGDGELLKILTEALGQWDGGHTDAYVTCVTSHAQAADLYQHYREHGTIPEELSCHRYNMGLHADDHDAIVMYYHEPTRWECWMHKMDHVGRPVCDGFSWRFIPEKEFQERQAATLKLLAERYGYNPTYE